MNSQSSGTVEAGTMGQLAGKYLTFSLTEEKYGVEILKVQEIIGVMNITKVPRSPEYMKGVINLRGKIIPVIDLRLKFTMPEKSYDEKTCIIVVNLELGNKMLPVGIVVDTVLEVTHFTSVEIESAPDYGMNVNTSFILGMGQKKEGDVTILIDIAKALNADEIAGIENAAEAAQAAAAEH